MLRDLVQPRARRPTTRALGELGARITQSREQMNTLQQRVHSP
jgi:hypothetical protein